MSRLSITLRISTKMNRRIFATVLGVAFCVTYLAGTTAMVGGLHETTASLAGSFDQGPVLVFTNLDFAQSRIDGNGFPHNRSICVAFCFANVTLHDIHGRDAEDVYAVSVFDPKDTLGLNMTNESVDGSVWVGTQLVSMLSLNSIIAAPDENYLLTGVNTSAEIRIDSVYSPGSIFPDDWLLVPRSTMDMLRPELKGDYSFLMIIESEAPLDQQPFMKHGVMTQPTSGVVGFFEEGIYQVEQGLWAIILMSGIMISLLVYCICSIETEYSGPTIRILRGIGSSRWYVVKVFLLKALFITFIGGILGTALGFCAASAISSVSSLLDIMTFITPVANLNSVVLPIAISVVSGIVGGIWPALKASKMFAGGRPA